MDMERYVKVIVPTKLDWDPWYRVPDGMIVERGERVRIQLAQRTCTAVVVEMSDSADIETKRIRPLLSIEDKLEPILPSEIEFWDKIADYYMCTRGEVYKYVYPKTRTAVESSHPRAHTDEEKTARRKLSDEAKNQISDIIQAMDEGKTVLYCAHGRKEVYAELCRRVVDDGSQVLLLKPGTALERNVVLRDRANAARKGEARVFEGSRMNIFLPFTRLGLVIVDEEQSPLHKQNTLAPRFNARDAALLLASVHPGAMVLMGTSHPSLESLYNARCGKYALVHGPSPKGTQFELIDSSAERQKKGMRGSLSLKLLSMLAEAFKNGKKALVAAPWTDTSELEIELRGQFPKVRTKLKVVGCAEIFKENIADFGIVAVIRGDYLFSKNDFRADEKALDYFDRLNDLRGELPFVVQGDAIADLFNVNTESILDERKAMLYPPFSRLIEITIEDKSEKRLCFMVSSLSGRLLSIPGCRGGYSGRIIRIFLPKDRLLFSRKSKIYKELQLFEEEMKYSGHITVNVDP